jgi:hypothetical protein
MTTAFYRHYGLRLEPQPYLPFHGWLHWPCWWEIEGDHAHKPVLPTEACPSIKQRSGDQINTGGWLPNQSLLGFSSFPSSSFSFFFLRCCSTFAVSLRVWRDFSQEASSSLSWLPPPVFESTAATSGKSPPSACWARSPRLRVPASSNTCRVGLRRPGVGCGFPWTHGGKAEVHFLRWDPGMFL